MAHVSDLIAVDIEQYLRTHEQKGLLRFITCGSVDDGKSTLIGRLLFESKLLFADQLAAVEADSRKWGTQGGALDLALLVDGLAAEREQGITIDVAYRFFSTDRRKFIVADTPGHEQYTRNMITGASTADVAVILVDARKGVLTQTRRHSYLVSLVGIRKVALAINKMDLVGYSEAVFRDIVAAYEPFARQIGLTHVTPIPLSALRGDNIVTRSDHTPWYRGPTLMEFLETVAVDETWLQSRPFRLPVQWVNRPNLDFRGFAGTVAGGSIRPGERVRVWPSGQVSTVTRIVTRDGDLEEAVAGQSITLTLADEIDISRGDLLCPVDAPAAVADQFEATLVWLGDEPMRPGHSYLLKLGSRTAGAILTPPDYKVNVNTLAHEGGARLERNEIGVVQVTLDRRVAFDVYADNRDTGGFILIDRLNNNTVGAGLIRAAAGRAGDRHVQVVDVNQAARAAAKGQKPCVLWFTGPGGADLAALARLVEKKLHGMGRHTYLLDAGTLGHGLNRDLDQNEADHRAEAIRRVAEVALLMADAGLLVLVPCAWPYPAAAVSGGTPAADARGGAPVDVPPGAPERSVFHIDTTRYAAAPETVGVKAPETVAAEILASLQQWGILDRPWDRDYVI